MGAHLEAPGFGVRRGPSFTRAAVRPHPRTHPEGALYGTGNVVFTHVRWLSVAAALICTPPFMAGAQSRGDGPPPTYTRDIAPIIAKHCSVCHRPGGAGPFSLTSYSAVRSRARQVAAVTRSRVMPPWPAEPGYGDFLNTPVLTDAAIDSIARWVEGGAPE